MPQTHLRTSCIRGRSGAALIVASWLLATVVACHREPPPLILDPASRSPLHRQVAAGEAHSYRIALDAGQYLQLSVDQHRADVVVTFLDPAGRTLLVADNPSGSDGSRGLEQVVWVAETGGDYALTVQVREGWKLPGCYRLTIEKLGPPGEEDRRRAAAEAAIAAGVVLYGRGDRESGQQAIEKYLEARAAFESLQDLDRSADALYRIAKVRQRLGDRQAAIDLYGEAAEIYRDLGNHRQQAISLFLLCKLYDEVPELDRALAACGRAKGLWDEDRLGLAKTLNELGVVYRRLGDGSLAIANYDQALALWRELGNRWEEANVLHNRGRVYDIRGKKAHAVDDLLAALEIQRQLGKPTAIVTTLNTLGQLHDRYGETEDARRYFEQALEVADDDPRRRAITRTGLAWVAAELGDARAALELFRQARAIFCSVGSLAWEAVTLQGLGSVHAARGELPQALGFLTDALALRRRIRDRSGEAETLLAMARVERRRGDLEIARREIEEALVIIDDLRTRIATASPARAYYQALKHDYFDFHVDLLMDFHQRDSGAGFDAEALTAFERARARSLLELLSERGTALERGVDPDLLERRLILKARIQSKERLLVRWAEQKEAVPEVQIEKAELEQRELLREYEQLEERIRASSPRYVASTRPRTLTAAEIREQIVDRETILLEYKLGEERSFVWAVTPEKVESFVLPGREEIERPARQAYELITGNQTQSRSRSRQVLEQLSAILLDPVAGALSGKRRLLIVTEGALQLLPFSALPMPVSAGSDDGWEIISLPSASALAMLREQTGERSPAAGLLAMVADPVYGADDSRLAASPRAGAPVGGRRGSAASGLYPRLSYSGREADRILSLVPDAGRLEAVGFDANLDVVTSGALGSYRIVHFATHGELDMEDPELSRLVLSLVDRSGEPRDGLLHAYQIYDFELTAELVVLSACQTALGPRLRGEGLVGLTQGFLHAGAERLLVSLWQVDDKTTAELMERFYRRLLIDGLSPPAALRAAQEPIRHQAPYYWAGFVLQGEWRDIRRELVRTESF